MVWFSRLENIHFMRCELFGPLLHSSASTCISHLLLLSSLFLLFPMPPVVPLAKEWTTNLLPKPLDLI